MSERKYKDFGTSRKTKWVLWQHHWEFNDNYVTGFWFHDNIKKYCLTYSEKLRDALIFDTREEAIFYYLKNNELWGFDCCTVLLDDRGEMREKHNIMEYLMSKKGPYREHIVTCARDICDKSFNGELLEDSIFQI